MSNSSGFTSSSKKPVVSVSSISNKPTDSPYRATYTYHNLDDDDCDADNNTPLDSTPKNSYLEKEMTYKKLNEELEKRSYEIFQKLEQYTDRSRKKCMSAAGDAPISPAEENFYKDPEEVISPHSSCNSYASNFSSLRLSSTAKSSRANKNTSSYESIGSIRSSKSQKLYSSASISASTSDTISINGVDIKAKNRLQKATESVVKCLQSKLVNHEGRLADLHLQFRQKIQENTMLESKVRALEDDRERLLKSISGLQNSTDKFSKMADVAKNNLNLKVQAFGALKKDIDTLKREQKQKAGLIQNLQTRLNRCLEENERLKNQTRSTQMNMRDKQQEDRAVIDELQQRVCQLEQQKNILNATIIKQSGLIKTLKNQKVQFVNIFHELKIPIPSLIITNCSSSAPSISDDLKSLPNPLVNDDTEPNL